MQRSSKKLCSSNFFKECLIFFGNHPLINNIFQSKMDITETEVNNFARKWQKDIAGGSFKNNHGLLLEIFARMQDSYLSL